MQIYIYIHIYIYTCICICMCMYKSGCAGRTASSSTFSRTLPARRSVDVCWTHA